MRLAGARLFTQRVEGAEADAGDLIGPYRLFRELGHGGMGTVEEAADLVRRAACDEVEIQQWHVGNLP